MSKEEMVRATRLRRAALYLNGQDNGCNEIKTLRDLVEAAQAQQKDDSQPVAYAVFADNGNIRIWSTSCEAVGIKVMQEEGKEAVPLFTRSDADEVERLRIDLELTRLARQSDQIEIDGLKALCDGFRAQLADAAQSLETISRLAGRDEFMEDMTDVRGYANSRASVARGALSAIAEHKCETCHDQGEVFVSKGEVEYGMLTEPEPIYKPCPDCTEPANKESAQ